MKQSLLLIIILSILNFSAQDIAPNFTVTDINGTTHTLYNYLDEGKTVILDFYAVWCNPCQENAAGVESVYEALGPDGTNEIMILGLEGDDDTTDDLVQQYAIDYNCSNPQINYTLDVMDLYNVSYYPTYFVVCPDRSYIEYSGLPEEISTNLSLGVELCAPVYDFDNDPRIFAYNSSAILCSDQTTPNITLMNMGQNELTSADLLVYLNGELNSTTNWEGSLNTYDFEFISLPTVTLGGLDDPIITVTVENPNGNEDSNPDNNSISTPITFGGTNFETNNIHFELVFDNFPQETSWTFSNSEGEIIVSGDDYIGSPNFSDPIDTTFTLPDDCYTFTIYDTYGDGICCAYADPGEGYWKISTAADLIMAEGGVFTDEESAIFGVSNPDGILELSNSSFVIYPNPASDRITLESNEKDYNWSIYSLDGRLLMDGIANGNSQNTIVFENAIAKGSYLLILRTDEGSIQQVFSVW